jgi:prepilin-type N-terminal cleavage/methylation domain-containing protein
MIQQKKQWFTLVELIVVITILAILWTIAFISLQWFARESRNSARVSDVATIRSALSFYSTENSRYPDPDNAQIISYSWAGLWKQWSFWEKARIELWRISKDILDPALNTSMDYGVLEVRSDYQISTIYEVASVNIPWIESVYAADNSSFISQVEWTYDSYDLNARVWWDCNLITIPSLLLNEIPTWWELLVWNSYEFAYNDSQNLPRNVYNSVDIDSPGRWFQIEKVYDKCSVDDIADIDLYIAQVSTAYQQYWDSEVFEDIVFTSDTKAFRLNMTNLLRENQIVIAPELLALLESPVPYNIFADSFPNSNGTELQSHSNIWWWWDIESGSSSAYSIEWNTLEKNDDSLSTFYPTPLPAITWSWSTVSYDVLDFWSWNITSYLRYQDTNNYYAAELSGNGYRLIRMLWWTESVIQDISETVTPPVNFSFSAIWTNIILSLWWIEKENTIITGVDWVWKPLIYMQNSWAVIDNYELGYK